MPSRSARSWTWTGRSARPSSTGTNRRVLRCRLEGCDRDVLDLLGRDRRRVPRSRLVGQTIKAILPEPGTPPADRVRRAAHPPGNRFVIKTLTAAEHDPGPQRQRLRGLRPPRPPRQLFTLIIGENQFNFRTPSSRHPPNCNLTDEIKARDTRWTRSSGRRGCSGRRRAPGVGAGLSHRSLNRRRVEGRLRRGRGWSRGTVRRPGRR